jgi:coiled-coil domain-containing protein 130
MQGFNMGRYNPPSALDPALSSTKTGGFNSQGHPLGQRARKLATEGALTVRFEMPFRIWCENCKPESIIDQGVRFNAEKKRVGKYYSSTIWAFRMKHTACGGFIEIRTDPQHSKYVVTEGARARDFGEEDNLEGHFGEIITEEERERRKNDAMAALEGKVKEKETVKSEARHVEELLDYQDKHWEDPYTANQKLRRAHRAQRKIDAAAQKDREGVAEQFGLGFEILDVTQGDKDRAALIEFGDADGRGARAVERIKQKPLFATVSPSKPDNSSHSRVKKTKAEVKSDKSKSLFQQEISGNTRATKDPFLLASQPSSKQRPVNMFLAGVKRKRTEADVDISQESIIDTEDSAQSRSDMLKSAEALAKPTTTLSLVDYYSEEE